MDRKIRDLTEDFQSVVLDDEQMLKEAFAYFNEEALINRTFAQNFALYFSSRALDSLVSNGSKIRAEMLNILQQNYINAPAIKLKNPNHFYNSITLLGEYYNRSRIADSPVKILGQSLWQLLMQQLQAETDKCLREPDHVLDVKFSKLILTQISLNGALAKPCHKAEIDALLYEVRKCLIEIPNLEATTKALLLMTLDLYLSNFANVGRNLEKLYSQFLYDLNDDTNDAPTITSASLDNSKSTSNSISNESSSLNVLRNEVSNLSFRGGSGISSSSLGRVYQPRVNKEYIGRPLKASDRLKFVRKQNAPEARQETEELAQEKLFEKHVEDMKAAMHQQQQDLMNNLPSSNVIGAEPISSAESTPEKRDDTSITPPNSTKSTKERRADKPHFLARPVSVRQRLKVAQQPPEHSDWYTEVENHNQNNATEDVITQSPIVSPNATTATATTTTAATSRSNHNNNNSKNQSKHVENSKNHLNTSRSNYSNPVSPNEIHRNNNRNHSFRSNKSDRSTQSVDRHIEYPTSKFDFKIFENRRHNYRGGSSGGGGDNNSHYGSQTWSRNNWHNNRGGDRDGKYGQYGGRGGQQYASGNGGGNNLYNKGSKMENGANNYSGGNNSTGQNKQPLNQQQQQQHLPPKNRYQRQQSIESESGVQKRFNVHNNRQYNNSNYNGGGNFNSRASGGGGRYQKNHHRGSLNRSSSMSKQSDDEAWDSYNDRVSPPSNKVSTAAAQHSQEFLKYLDN